jgi:hypothetical protein
MAPKGQTCDLGSAVSYIRLDVARRGTPHTRPSFDPTRRKIGGLDLNGWYEYDDEGVKARRVPVVVRWDVLACCPHKSADAVKVPVSWKPPAAVTTVYICTP